MTEPAQPVLQHEPLSTCRLLAMSVPLTEGHREAHSVAADIREKLAKRGDLQQMRWFTESDGTLWTLAAFDSAVSADALANLTGRPGGKGVASFNVYAPYRRSSY